MGCAAIRKELNSLERWAGRNITTLSQVKCKVLHMGKSIPMCQYELQPTGWKAAVWKRGVLVHTKMSMCQQRALAAKQASNLLGCISCQQVKGR